MNDSTALLVGCGCALIVAMVAAVGGWLVRGSTAVPAALWAVAAAGSLAAELAVRAAGGLADPAASAAVRLVSLALAVCPVMALLGAKRPQHGVWQFIVGSLAFMLAMPAVSATLVRPGTMPDVHALQRWFMPLLVGVGWMNFAATRHGPAAAVVASGQMLLVRPFLPFVAETVSGGSITDVVGAVLMATGAVLAAVQSAAWPVVPRSAADGRRSRVDLPTAGDPLAGIERPFLALRETLGAAWALRIAERFNAVAAERGWPCRLRFAGLDPACADGPWRGDAERAFRALARRFASTDWLRRHSGGANVDGPHE